MKRYAWLLTLLYLTPAAGCVERRFVITSDPPGALVVHNGVVLGATPCDDSFVYYGKHQFTLIKDGYQTLHAEEKITTPWYEWPGIDFISENIYPCKIADVRRLHFTLQPMVKDPPEGVSQRAQELRQRGKAIGVPTVSGPPPVAP